jgi:lipopolysaccharide cholinephosphotransferase
MLLNFEINNMKFLLLIIIMIMIIYRYILRNNILCENFENANLKNLNKLSFVQDMELKKLLKILHFNLYKNNIDYSICGGTLLGAIRHKNRIQWDDNGDIFILEDGTNKEKKLEDIDWKKYDCFLYKNRLGYKFCFKNTNIGENEEEYNYPYVNIFIFTKIYDIWTYKNEICRENWPLDYFYDNELYPLRKYRFGDVLLNGPNKPYTFLTRSFGNGWEINAEIKVENKNSGLIEKIKFIIPDKLSENKFESIKYLWIMGTEENLKRYPEEKLIEKFNDDYTLIFINQNNIEIYLKDNFDLKDKLGDIRKLIFKKYGGKFLTF